MSEIRADNLATRTGAYTTPMEDPVRGSCRAWINWNGTGTVAIRAAYNVSSITDNGTGDYTLNLTNPMPDTNYVVLGMSGSNPFGTDLMTMSTYLSVPPTVSAIRIIHTLVNSVVNQTSADGSILYAAVFGNP